MAALFFRNTLGLVALSSAALASPESTSAAPPNIILILSDDEDIALGGLNPLSKTKSWLRDQGTTMTNYFVTTPVCCPSRTSMLSGRYAHNLDDLTQGWCGNFVSSGEVNTTFAVDLSAKGYRTGLFGKWVNNDCGVAEGGTQGMGPYYVPAGWDSFFGMCNENIYWGMIWNDQGTRNATGTFDNEKLDGTGGASNYSTSLIGNRTTAFVSQALDDAVPFFAMVNPHAPHVPATPAPWHLDSLPNVTAVVTPAYDVAPVGHHWLVSDKVDALSPELVAFSDTLARMRQLSLLAVDDIVNELHKLLMGHPSQPLDNTFVIYTSDHGYSLGQMRLASGKYHVFENDVRAPFFIAGPGVAANALNPAMSSNIDISATILDLAGCDPKASGTDGMSLVPALLAASGDDVAPTWPRDRILLEYWGCCDASATSFVWRGGCACDDPYPNQCGVGDCGADGVHDALLDAPSNTWVSLRVVNTSHDLAYVEYRGRNDAPSPAFTNFTALYDVAADPDQLTNVLALPPAEAAAYLAKARIDVMDLQEELFALATCLGDSCLTA